MIEDKILKQVKELSTALNNPEPSCNSIAQLTQIELALNLPSVRGSSPSDRVAAAQTAISELVRLHKLPSIDDGVTTTELLAYRTQQLEVLKKLDVLDRTLSDSSVGVIARLVNVKDKTEQEELHKELYDTPISKIVRADPILSKNIQIIDIKHPGSEAVILRLHSQPNVGYPIWPRSADGTSSKGKIVLESFDTPSARNANKVLPLTYSSICACCEGAVVGGESPFYARRPKEMDSEAWQKWKQSADGLADQKWRDDRVRDFVVGLTNACNENGIVVLASRKSYVWRQNFNHSVDGLDKISMREVNEGYFNAPYFRVSFSIR